MLMRGPRVIVSRREVQRDERRVGPVEQPRRQTVVLAERQPVPRRIDGDGVAGRVLAKVPQKMTLENGRIAAELREAGREIRVRICAAAEGEV